LNYESQIGNIEIKYSVFYYDIHVQYVLSFALVSDNIRLKKSQKTPLRNLFELVLQKIKSLVSEQKISNNHSKVNTCFYNLYR